MPAAAKILSEKGLSAGDVAGSGKDGRVTKGDALAASAKPAVAPLAPAAAKPALQQVATPTIASLGDRPEERVPMSRLRARIAERLVMSQSTNAILTTFNEVNMQPVIDLRNKSKDKFEKEHGVKLGFMSFFVKAAVAALKKYPIINASVAKPLPSVAAPVATKLGDRPEQRVPMSRLRARIAERLVQSQSTNAILTTFNEVNMQPVMDLRTKYKDKFEKEHGVKLGFMSFFVKAAVAALKKYPIINASVDGNDIVYHGYFDIGIAVGSPRGLVVPILRNADQMSIAEIEKKIGEFGAKAKEGKLTLEDLTGGTFSISNGGTFGSMLSTPIINPPQSAILGVHATKDRAVVENGLVVVRPMNYLAMSYDHRIIDGREAVLGLVAMKETLEDPARLLLDL